MKFIKVLPFQTQYEKDEPMEIGLWESDKNICEFSSSHMPDPTDTSGECDNSTLYYGTTDEHEPSFCARHFYLNVIKDTYNLIEPITQFAQV